MTDFALALLDYGLRVIIAFLAFGLVVHLIRGPRSFPWLPKAPDPLAGMRSPVSEHQKMVGVIKERLQLLRAKPNYGVDPFVLSETNSLVWLLHQMGEED